MCGDSPSSPKGGSEPPSSPGLLLSLANTGTAPGPSSSDARGTPGQGARASPQPPGDPTPGPCPSSQRAIAGSPFQPEIGGFWLPAAPARAGERRFLTRRCLMSTKYFHVANYLVRLCCCGQCWCGENPAGAAPVPGEWGKPWQGLPSPSRAGHPCPHHAPPAAPITSG